jgi:DNA polymerase III subunit epsilon
LIILGIDLETSGLNPDVDIITEIGAVLYDARKQKPITMLSYLVKPSEDFVMDPKVVGITGLCVDTLQEHGGPLEQGIDALKEISKKADYFMAHNHLFDSSFLKAAGFQIPKVWIDSRTDIPFPEHIGARKLVHLAAEHGFANPFSHRAVFDVMTMFRVMEQYDLADIISLANEPTVKCIAKVSYQNREQAKERGYYWDGESKQWFKLLKQSQAQKEESEAPFMIATVEAS